LKQHICRKCGKRFNRPSSLKIHLNTHSGAQREFPFVLAFVGFRPVWFRFVSSRLVLAFCGPRKRRETRTTSLQLYSLTALIPNSSLTPAPTAYCCPFPGCGRAFNVNSNMRRHLRNHPAPPAPVPMLGNHFSQAQTQAPTPSPAPTHKTSTRTSPIRPDASPPATHMYVPRRKTRSGPHPAPPHAPPIIPPAPAPEAGNFHTYLGYYTHTPAPPPLRTWTPASMRHCESDVRNER
jgi:hypothetical protein